MTEAKPFRLLPPAPGTCPICAVKHSPEDAHNRDSLYWQFSRAQEGLPPATWSEAIAHCDPRTQRLWAISLANFVEAGRINKSQLGPLVERLIREQENNAVDS